jgi:hypothetical protein
MSYQDELNRIAKKPGNWSVRDCLNALAGTTNLDSTLAANTYAETTGLRHQDAINAKASKVGLTKQNAAKLIATPE